MRTTCDELDRGRARRLQRAYASGTLRVSYDGKSVEYGSAADLLARIRTIEAEIAAPPAARSRAAASPPSARGDP